MCVVHPLQSSPPSSGYCCLPLDSNQFGPFEPLKTAATPLQLWDRPPENHQAVCASVRIPLDQPFVTHSSPPGTGNRVRRVQSHSRPH